MRKTMLLVLAVAALPAPALAGDDVSPVTVRFDINPGAGDPAWQQPFKFEKMAQCYRSSDPTPSKYWPVNFTVGGGVNTQPLFAGTPGNAIFLTMTDFGGTKKVTCRGSILVDGVDMTLHDGVTDVSSVPVEQLGRRGAIGLSPRLDAAKFQQLVDAKGTPPAPLRSGTATLPQTHMFSFDAGEHATDWTEQSAMDLIFSAKTATDLSLASLNGALQSAYSASERGYKGCKAAAYSAAPIPVSRRAGLYYCLKTRSGRFAEYRITKFVPAEANGGSAAVTFSYTVWP